MPNTANDLNPYRQSTSSHYIRDRAIWEPTNTQHRIRTHCTLCGIMGCGVWGLKLGACACWLQLEDCLTHTSICIVGAPAMNVDGGSVAAALNYFVHILQSHARRLGHECIDVAE